MLTIHTAPFLSALTRVTPLCQRSTLPILNNVFLNGTAEGLVIGAQNGDMALAIRVPQSEGKFSTTLPAARLLGITRELAGSEFSMGSCRKGTVAIKSGAFAGQISTLAEEFPAAPKLGDTKAHFRMPVENLRDALRRTAFAASEAAERAALDGVRVVLEAEGIVCVATDGRRLAFERTKAEVLGREIAAFTVPTAAVVHLLKAVAAEEGTIDVRFDGALLAFATKHTTFSTKVLDIPYPRWEQVIPQPGALRVSVNREALLAAISRTTIIDGTRLVLDVRGETLRVSTSAAEIGESEDTIAAWRLSGGAQPDLRIVFSPALLGDALGVLCADEVVLEFAESTSPLIVEVGGWKYVAMPIRRQGKG